MTPSCGFKPGTLTYSLREADGCWHMGRGVEMQEERETMITGFAGQVDGTNAASNVVTPARTPPHELDAIDSDNLPMNPLPQPSNEQASRDLLGHSHEDVHEPQHHDEQLVYSPSCEDCRRETLNPMQDHSFLQARLEDSTLNVAQQNYEHGQYFAHAQSNSATPVQYHHQQSFRQVQPGDFSLGDCNVVQTRHDACEQCAGAHGDLNPGQQQLQSYPGYSHDQQQRLYRNVNFEQTGTDGPHYYGFARSQNNITTANLPQYEQVLHTSQANTQSDLPMCNTSTHAHGFHGNAYHASSWSFGRNETTGTLLENSALDPTQQVSFDFTSSAAPNQTMAMQPSTGFPLPAHLSHGIRNVTHHPASSTTSSMPNSLIPGFSSQGGSSQSLERSLSRLVHALLISLPGAEAVRNLQLAHQNFGQTLEMTMEGLSTWVTKMKEVSECLTVILTKVKAIRALQSRLTEICAPVYGSSQAGYTAPDGNPRQAFIGPHTVVYGLQQQVPSFNNSYTSHGYAAGHSYQHQNAVPSNRFNPTANVLNDNSTVMESISDELVRLEDYIQALPGFAATQ